MSRKVRIVAEWAVWGKPPGTRDDYGIRDCSRGRLSRDDFGEIVTRYAPGTLADLPQATISWVGGGDRAHIGLAVQDWSGQQDGLGRDIAVTRYFCVPYAQVADGPVTYEALYHAFRDCTRPVDGLFAAEVPVLDPEKIAGMVDETAMDAAALLLTDRQVCLVRGESVPMLDRLRFLDTVAALLPYGLRTKLTASTWTDSSARHRIKLSFAKHARDGAYSVTWGAQSVPYDCDESAKRYYDLLAGHSPGELVSRLAGYLEPMSFRDAPSLAPALLDDTNRTQVHTSWEVPTPSHDDLAATLKHASHLNEARRREALQRWQTVELVEAAAREPFELEIVSVVCREITARGGAAGAEDPGIASALRDHDYLTVMIESLYPEDGAARYAALRALLVAAYGQSLSPKAFEEVVGYPPVPQSASLIAAAASLYGPGAEAVLMQAILRHARLGPGLMRRVRAELSAPAPGRSSTPEPPPTQDYLRHHVGEHENARSRWPPRPGLGRLVGRVWRVWRGWSIFLRAAVVIGVALAAVIWVYLIFFG